MKLSAPIFHLKRLAKSKAKTEGIPLHAALDHIAQGEGFKSWSHLSAIDAELDPAARLFSRLKPGNLVLIAARPGQGKTLFGLKLAAQAEGRAFFFTLEYTEQGSRDRLLALEIDTDQFELDCSDNLCSAHIMERMESCPRGTIAVIDYLQLLDQRRESPPLEQQVRDLREFAQKRGVILAFLSQVHRSFDESGKDCPEPQDVRLPNPLDLSLIDHLCFLHGGKVVFR